MKNYFAIAYVTNVHNRLNKTRYKHTADAAITIILI